MSLKKDRLTSRRVSRSLPRLHEHMPHASDTRHLREELWNDDNFQSFDATHYALQTLNNHIERRLEKVHANTLHLKRELWLLQRHVKEFRHPLFETWEADLLTRLIEVAHAQQYQTLPGGIVIGQPSFSEHENLTLAYSTVAKGIRMQTLCKLGLSEQYHQALQRYPEIAPYRSRNPYLTEFAFAKWLIEERDSRPELYEFWSKLFPICYNRSVQTSASVF